MNPGQAEPGEDALDPRLAAVVGAILDGATVDWTSCTDGVSGSFRDELRIVAGIAGVHRSLVSEERRAETAPFPPQLPWQAGALTITESLGKGAFGEVFRAWDTQLRRDVALKLLFRDRGADEDDAHRSLEEGRLLAKVRHPNIVAVHGAERIEGRVALVTELVDGRTLSDIVRHGGPLPPDVVASIGVDLCRALSAVHDAGLLHRDIKSQNVMREHDGRIVLMDFGAGHHGGAVPQALAGTPLYLAPEVLDDGRATVQSDVYSLGVLLHYLATGDYPVTGASLAEIRRNHAERRRTRVRAARADVPRAIADAIDRATDPDPSRRYATAGEFEGALARSLQLPAERRRQWLTAGAVAAAAVLLALAVTKGSVAIPGIIRAGGDVPSASSAVAADTASTTVSHVPLPPFAILGRPSRDGRFLPYTDVTGNLWVREVATGQSVQVAPGKREEFVWAALMSPDGSRIAYVTETDAGCQVRLGPVDGGSSRIIWENPEGGGGAGMPEPLEWSQDGQQILYSFEREDGTSDLALMPAEGGPRAVLASFREGTPRHASLSPDARLVVFDLPAGDGTAQRDLMIVRTDGSEPQPLLTGPHNDLLPSWTPDGKGIFFASNRSGLMSGWLLPVHDEQAVGDPSFIVKNLERIWPLGLTDAGRYFYVLQIGAAEVYTATIDLSGATLPSKPARVSESVSMGHLGPAWSPDGRSLAYIAQRGNTAQDRDSNTLIVQDVESGLARTVAIPALSHVGVVPPQWSPDSRLLLVRGRDNSNRHGLYVVDPGTGALHAPLPVGQTNRYHWSRDGQSVMYLRALREVVERQVFSGEERVVFDAATHGMSNLTSFGPSPDGRSIALSGWMDKTQAALLVYTPAGGPREMFRSSSLVVFQAWAPDAQQILFTLLDEQPHTLMRIPSSGGEPIDMQLPIHGFTQVNFTALSPDGRRLAYTAGQPGIQVWMMERFLPR